MKHPIQPLRLDEYGVLRYKENKIVSKILAYAKERGYSLNDIACDDFDQNDREQFAQLIGYSHSGAGDLSYMSDEVHSTAYHAYETGMTEDQAKVEVLSEQSRRVKDGLRGVCSEIFKLHPDDLI